MARAANDWLDANQRYLTARLAAVRARLSASTADAAPDADAAGESALAEMGHAMSAPPALDVLCDAFGLSSFERDVLLLCAAVELDSAFRLLWGTSRFGSLHGPTFGLALAALPDAHWSALTPAAPLRYWRLVDVGPGESLTTSPLRLDERVLHYLTGISYVDERLHGFVELQPPPRELPPSHRVVADGIAALWKRSDPAALPVVHLRGNDAAGKRALAAFGCAALGMQLRVLRGADVPPHVPEREALARLWDREAILRQAALLLDCDEAESPRAALALPDHVRAAVLVAGSEPVRLRRREVVRFDVDRPTPAEQRSLWGTRLGTQAALPESLDRLVSQFDLGADEIGAVALQAIGGANGHEEGALDRLWDACRATARGGLEGMAQRIEPVAEWNDLVLPAAPTQTLRDIAAQVRQRSRVYEAWAFASKGTRGLGISALFAGPSGTGKTMAAEVLARELRLDLFRIDLSQVVNKYIGETEKNLRRVFDAAEAGGAVLLFDEADALFGKRSEVKDSHDRYANIEISYLLQRMESYRGLAILTTNMKNALDPAFLRRLRFVVHFPFPDKAHRAEIWRRVYPVQTPVAGLDAGKLAQLNVAGGNIRNIAMQAAFLAADAGEPVGMGHLLRAARSEYEKLEKPLTDAECKEWT